MAAGMTSTPPGTGRTSRRSVSRPTAASKRPCGSCCQVLVKEAGPNSSNRSATISSMRWRSTSGARRGSAVGGGGGGVGPGEFADDSVPGQAGVDLADQVQVLVGVGGHVHVDQGRPGAFEQVGEFGHEQPGGAGDGAAPSGEGTVGEQSRGVGQ